VKEIAAGYPCPESGNQGFGSWKSTFRLFWDSPGLGGKTVIGKKSKSFFLSPYLAGCLCSGSGEIDMVKVTQQNFPEVNRLLLELKGLLPGIQFRYSDKTGLLEGLTFEIEEEPFLDLNFFDSLPRSFPTPNVLKKSVSRASRSVPQNQEEKKGTNPKMPEGARKKSSRDHD